MSGHIEVLYVALGYTFDEGLELVKLHPERNLF